MKTLSSFFTLLCFLVLSFAAQAQTTDDYFPGKWNVIVEGTPGGDAKMIVSLERKEGKLVGVILDSLQKEVAKISSIEEKDKAVTLNFTSQGYDVNLVMEKKDDDHVTGNMLGMFDAKGERIKEIKK